MIILQDLNLDLSPYTRLYAPLMGLPEGLACMPAVNNLEDICVSVSVDNFTSCCAQMQTWEQLDSVLGDRSRFMRLESVKISVSARFMHDDGADILFMGLAEECFQRCGRYMGQISRFEQSERRNAFQDEFVTLYYLESSRRPVLCVCLKCFRVPTTPMQVLHSIHTVLLETFWVLSGWPPASQALVRLGRISAAPRGSHIHVRLLSTPPSLYNLVS